MHTRSPLLAIGLLALAACAPPAPPEAPPAPPPPDYAAEHQPAMDALIAAWNQDNLDGLDAALVADFQRRSPAGLDSDGLAAFKQVVSDMRAGYPDMQVTLDESHFMADVSFHLWTFTGTNSGAGATPPTGKAVKLSGATLIRYRDGKIAEELVYFDLLEWQTQLGYTVTPPASEAAPAAP